LVPLNPTSIVTTAPAGNAGATGTTDGVVPLVITSGSYTDNAPVAGSRIVACTNAPRFAAFAIVQPDAAGVIPFGPVSCHGVASPAALSGFAGTMMSQLTLTAAAAVAVGLADTVGVTEADADAVGQIVEVAAAVGVAAVVLAAGVARAGVEVAAADVLGVGTAAAVAAVDAAVDAVVDGVAQAPTADSFRLPPLVTTLRPRAKPRTKAMATGTASRAARLLGT
jgi:hypothetical protein